MNEPELISAPCQYMIFDKDGYHTCELMPAKQKRFLNGELVETDGIAYCLCAWFYDMCNPGFTVELSIDPKTRKFSSVSTFDFPDSQEYKDMVARTMTEDDVPRLCPRGFTFKQIDAKIQPLREKWLRSKHYRKRLREFEAWEKKLSGRGNKTL